MTMFSKLFSLTDKFEVRVDFDSTPISGKYVGADSAFIYLSASDKSIHAIALCHILSCKGMAVEALQESMSSHDKDSGDNCRASNKVSSTESAMDSIQECHDSSDLDPLESNVESTAMNVSGTQGFSDDTTDDNADFRIDPASGIFKSSAETIGKPKVLYTIDLNSTPDKKRVKIASKESNSEAERPKQQSDQKYNDSPLWSLNPEPMGTVKSTGPKFGIVTNDKGELFVYQNYNALDRLYPEDKVLFTTYVYNGKNGEQVQAKSVVKVRSVGSMLKKLEKLDEIRDKNKISDVVEQIKQSFPDNDTVWTALADRWLITEEELEENHQRDTKAKELNQYEFKHVLKRMAATMLPDNYDSYSNRMKRMIEERKSSRRWGAEVQLYDLYLNLIKNSYGREEERLAIIDEAVDYYDSIDEGTKALYFERMRTRRPYQYEKKPRYVRKENQPDIATKEEHETVDSIEINDESLPAATSDSPVDMSDKKDESPETVKEEALSVIQTEVINKDMVTEKSNGPTPFSSEEKSLEVSNE